MWSFRGRLGVAVFLLGSAGDCAVAVRSLHNPVVSPKRLQPKQNIESRMNIMPNKFVIIKKFMEPTFIVSFHCIIITLKLKSITKA